MLERLSVVDREFRWSSIHLGSGAIRRNDVTPLGLREAGFVHRQDFGPGVELRHGTPDCADSLRRTHSYHSSHLGRSGPVMRQIPAILRINR